MSEPRTRTKYTYDSNGNTTSKTDSTGTTNYTWDFENRLTQVTLPGTGGTVSYRYDPFGRRIQKAFTQNGTTTTTNYLYDGNDTVEEADQNGNLLAKYARTTDTDEPLAEYRSGVTNYYEQEWLGTVSSLSNSAGTLMNTYTYDSFGKITNSSGTIQNPLRYAGRDFDTETGLYYDRARYLDPTTGRFLSEDPIGFKAGPNFYDYVGNNPNRYRDSTGLLRDCDQEQIDCFNKCYKTKCLPWPHGTGSSKVATWSRYAYCQTKCLAVYMECEAANDAERLKQFCSNNPLACAAMAAAAVAAAASGQPELIPAAGAAF